MARYEFKLPDIGEGVAEGEIVRWLVEPGQAVREDEPMVEVMTDKATVTIDAPRSGQVVELRGAVGDSVKVGAVLVVFELGASAVAEASTGAVPSRQGANGAAPRAANVSASACGDIRDDLPGMRQLARDRAPAGISDGYFNAKPLATPATRRLARDLGIDLRTVVPTGRSSRVSSDDVRAAHAAAAPPPALAHAQPPAPVQAPSPVPLRPPVPQPSQPKPSRDDRALEERTPLRGLRKRIFESMALAKRMAAHSTFIEECNVTALKSLRERLKPKALEYGVRLSYLPFLLKATVAALKRHPALNATFDEATQEIVTRRYYNLGIATATDAGLTVPVIQHADQLPLLEVARSIDALAERARAQRLAPDEVQGSTFTITSLGQLGGLLATPILHYPEVAILGVHQIKQKPVVKDGAIVIGDVMLLSLTFDHRLIDGHVAAAFVYELIAYLEAPETLLLEMI